MKFDRIAGSIGPQHRKNAQGRFQSITLELGCREDNEHVGSGLGGNPSQLMALMTFSHELVDSNLTIEIDRGLMRWGSDFLLQSRRRDIRHELDIKLPIAKYTQLDPRTDPRFSLGPNIAQVHLLMFANKLCADLASELDRGDETNVTAVGMALVGFPMEIILMSVRRYIQIERLVKFNLDEHPAWEKVLSRVNKEVDNN